MYEKLLLEAEKIIEEQKKKELPILELWEEISEKADELKFELPENLGDFECLIEGDKRFVLVTQKVESEIEDIDLGEEEGEYEVSEDFFEVEEMEKLGFNQDQLVRLKKYERKSTADEDDDDDMPVKTPASSVKKPLMKSVVKNKLSKAAPSKSRKKKKKK